MVESVAGALHLVSTPIGNLGDVSFRARDILAAADRIYAEDTRRARVLLEHLGVSARPRSLHGHNEAERQAEVLAGLQEGEMVVLLSDAGTPLVSDPGGRIVSAAARGGYRIVPIPGPSAVLAALVASGLPADRFAFLGFPPRKGRDRAQFLERVAGSPETTVLFESPKRLVRLLVDLGEGCDLERRVAIGRELTKAHEEFFRGTLKEAARYYEEHPPRGEVTLVVDRERTEGAGEELDREAVEVLARSAMARGLSPSEAARDVARRLNAPRNAVYRIVQSLGP